MKQQIILLKGLPASGKTTFARQWVSKDPTKRVRINKDDLRAMMHNSHYSKGNESLILKVEEAIITEALLKGKSVILDNTHLATNKDGSNKHLERIKSLVNNELLKQYQHSILKNSIEIELRDIWLNPEDCIKRDLKRPNSVGSDVIWRMYWQHIYEPKEVEQVAGLEPAIIVDIDGTLAKMHNRHPFQWEKVGEDNLVPHIRNLICAYHHLGYKIILMSGRDSVCREDTIEWLDFWCVSYDYLYMRPEGNTHQDTIIKRRLYKDHIEGQYNIRLVVDDRPSVIRMWKTLGLPVISADPTIWEF